MSDIFLDFSLFCLTLMWVLTGVSVLVGSRETRTTLRVLIFVLGALGVVGFTVFTATYITEHAAGRNS